MRALGALGLFAVLSLTLVLGSCETLQRAALPIAEANEPRGLFRLDAGGQPVVWLTIDDGPSIETDSLLEILSDYDATATFFLHTNHIEDAQVLTRIAVADHNLGNHMPSDRDWSVDSAANFRTGFLRSHCALSAMGEAYTGRFRPPLGRYNSDTMLPVLLDTSVRNPPTFVLASFIPWDAGGVTEQRWEFANRILAERYGRGLGRAAKAGDIVVFHDGPRLKRTKHTKTSLRHFLETLEKRGLQARALPATPTNTSLCSD